MEVIDWSKLRTKNGKQDEAFELFCYCIAQKKFGHLGKFISIDGKGGDGGIEFYLELDNGNIWGWQAKYFNDTGRLKDGGRKTQISNSLKSACENYGDRLKKWFLCTNSEFTPGEIDWLKNTLTNEIPAHLSTKIKHWGEDKLDRWLITKSKFSGLLHYFFGELELTTEWFKNQYQVQSASVGDKFIKELHTENSEVYKEYIQPLLFEKETLTELQEKIKDAETNFVAYQFSRERFLVFAEEELRKEILDKVISCLDTFEDQYEDCWKEIYKLIEITSPNQVWLLGKYLCSIGEMLLEMEKFQKEIISSSLELIPEEVLQTKMKGNLHGEKNDGRIIRFRLKSNTEFILTQTRKIFYFLEGRIESNDLHFFGNAGVGKTHLSCSIVSNLIDKNQPAIFIPAAKFRSSEALPSQLKRILDIPESYSVEEFFDALDIAAFSQNVRCPIIIDGINESITENGRLNAIWKNYLPGFIEMVSQQKNLVLITTCRPSYEEAIWENERVFRSSNRIDLMPFDSEDTEILIRKYFKYYKINADLTYQSFNSFDKPLHLKIFCEAKNSDRKNDVEVELGDELIYDSFNEFIKVCDKRIYKFRKQNFDIPPLQENKKVATNALEIIGKYLWENHTRYIGWDEFYELKDNNSTNHDSSKTNALINEGLLMCRDFYDGSEVVGITYDMLSGYVIANYLFQKYKEDLSKFIKSKEAFDKLFSNDYSKHHPQFEDIRGSLTALLPQKIGKHFYEVLPKSRKYNPVFDLAYEKIFKVSSKFITQKEIEFITSYLEIPENRVDTFRLAKHLFCSTENPFNIKYWTEFLKKLTLVDRDLCWSEFLRENNYELSTLLEDFEVVVKLDTISKVKENRTHLIAEYALWSMTTVNISTRDKASKGLYYYGRRFPKHFLELLKLSFEINDPVLRERMILIAYGIILARRYDFTDDSFVQKDLPLFAKTVFNFLFKPRAKYATTHILIRDTGKCIIEVAQEHHPKLFSADQINRIYPPYKSGGIRNWKELEDKNDKRYKEGNAPIDYYFKKNKLSLIADGDEYNPNEKMKKATARLFWRITNLGYKYELFEIMDIALARYKHYGSDDSDKMVKYGEKYATIALFELAGFIDDEDELPNYHDLDIGRFSESIIDPTFFESPNNKHFFEQDLLDKQMLDLKKWIFQEKVPDLKEILQFKNLNSENQSWVLLNSNIFQTDETLQKQIRIFPTSIFVRRQEAKKIKKNIEKQNGHLDLLGNSQGVSNIYQGEIPHSKLIHKNGIFKFYYKTGTEECTREIEKINLFQNGKKLSKERQERIFEKIKNDYGVTVLLSSGPLPSIVFSSKKDGESLDEIFSKLKISEEKEITLEKYYSDVENFFSYESPICKEHNRYLSKDMLESLDLINQPQSYNLFEKNGRIGSIYFRYGDDYMNTQSFLYLRKDLLDKYLNKNDLTMLQIVNGERIQYANLGKRTESIDPHYNYFNKVYQYDSKK